jgi:hypothetical protein
MPHSPPLPATDAAPNPTTLLTEAIDDFLSDLDKRFSAISDEILTRLDDMAERCDRLEGEILLSSSAASNKKGEGNRVAREGEGNVGTGLGIDEASEEDG